MHVQVSSRGLSLSDRRRAVFYRRIEQALGHFDSRVASVELVIQDENGPKGGTDKKAHITATIPRLGTLSVVEKTSRVGLSVRQALRKLSRQIVERVNRRRDMRRRIAPT